ncbi:MAG: diacylglycerol kinase family protein [Archangium sp.]|nr:diacylglycerol kinase family protein [Archangium sp.]
MDIALVVNLNSRRGSQRFADFAQQALPASRVVATRTLEDVTRFVDGLGRLGVPRVLLSGGGDGTAIGLLDALRAGCHDFPTLGIVKLGTGNAWAASTNAPSPRKALQTIARAVEQGHSHTALPTSDFYLLEVEGRLTPFAGSGWDAEVLHDYKLQRAALPEQLKPFAEGAPGYFASLFTRTVPRNLFSRSRPRVRLINLGAEALTFDPHGKVVAVPNSGPGTVLYDGPYGVAGAGTSSELGFGFKALHFARTMPGRMHARVYAAGTAEATRRLPQLWQGAHPLPHSHDFLLTHCRMEFDREVPVEIGGDAIGLRKSVEYRVAPQVVRLVEWERLGQQVN